MPIFYVCQKMDKAKKHVQFLVAQMRVTPHQVHIVHSRFMKISLQFWLFIVSFACLTGCTAMENNNQIVTQNKEVFDEVAAQVIPSWNDDVLTQGVVTGSSSWRYLDSHTVELGAQTAPNTLTVFTNLECPYCQQFMQEYLPTIMNEYISTQMLKVRFVFKSFQKYPQTTALNQALYCGTTLSKDIAFFTKVVSKNIHTIDEMKNTAKELQVDLGLYDACMGNTLITEELQKQQEVITKAGIEFIPHFYMNRSSISGLPTLAELQGFIKVHSITQ